MAGQDKRCRFCSNEFSPERSAQMYCSRSCSAKSNNPKRANFFCKFCGSPTQSSKYKYCNTYCKEEYLLQQWISGSIDGNGTYTIRAFVRRFVLKRANNSCELCGFNNLRQDGDSILEVDHIDGNWLNSTPSNLRALCPNCHHLTENFGSRNRGNGRTWKKVYNQYVPKTL